MGLEKQAENILFSEIALEIKQMVEMDQAMRERSKVYDYCDYEVDARNTERMKEIVKEIGWPTVSKVGVDGATNAWLLIQHADHDIAFQEHCLQLMKDVPTNEVSRVDIAYLEDRVRVSQGRGQLYGTQFTQENNQHLPEPIEDEKGVDERRVELGMGPLSEQIQLMYDQYPFKDEG